jgi:shikimate kinase
MIHPGSFFLVGPMGAGKSTIGRQLARALGLEFIDSDREIEIRTGVDIPLIFELEGESGFRRREHQVIELLTARKGIVLATGGGAVLDPDNRKCLAARGKVIYIHPWSSNCSAPPTIAAGRCCRRRTRARRWKRSWRPATRSTGKLPTG